MAKVKLKYIENVEGNNHLAFIEGKKLMDDAKADIRNAVFSLLLFCALLALFVLISGFNLYYLLLLLVFIVIFIAMIVTFSLQRKKGKKQCIKAVLASKNTDIVNKQASVEKTSRAVVESMSSTIDKYDAKEKFPGIARKLVRSNRHKKMAEQIAEFEEETDNKG